MTNTLAITVGIPASGKTFFAKEWVAASPTNRTRISRDDVRMNLMNMDPAQGVMSPDHENLVTKVQRGMVETFLKNGFSVCVDDTNLRLKVQREWAELATKCRADFRVEDFTHVALETCIARDAARDRTVGREVITKMHQRFKSSSITQSIPAEPIRQYVGDDSKPSAWLFDVDGTLALMGDRRGPYDFDKVHLDVLQKHVGMVAFGLRKLGHAIIIMSGRGMDCRDVTEDWLTTNDIRYDEIHMRKAGDMRKDSTVKLELFFGEVADRWNIVGVVDDRPSVCRAWREAGLKVLQVGDPHVEF